MVTLHELSGPQRAALEWEDRFSAALLYWVGRGAVCTLTPAKLTGKVQYPKLEIYTENVEMAKEKKSIGEWNGIARIPFNKPEKEAYDDWRKQEIDLETELYELIARDYKVSLSLDSNHDAIMCSVSCYDQKSPNYKYTMVSRAPTVVDALLVTLFKHDELCNGDWGNSPTSDDKWG